MESQIQIWRLSFKCGTNLTIVRKIHYLYSFLLIVGGVIFIYLSTNSPFRSRGNFNHYALREPLNYLNYQLNPAEQEGTDINTHFFSSQEKNQYILLFVVEANICGNCLTEVDEYSKLTNDFLGSENLKQLIWFHNESEPLAKHFARVAQLSITERYYSLSGLIPPQFIRFNETTRMSQAILLGIQSQEILYRIDLNSNEITNIDDKEKIIEKLYSSL